ncbi:hypothetical protein DFH09DRAFT_1282583 [Mycena vulgaris]|nr:hypothetical protein DFH09DRAFT_1282583 [Mycena vulgaris]
MASPLDSTFGVWLVALFLESILYGMGLLQVYLYFLWYHKDNWVIKGTTATVPRIRLTPLFSILETFQTVTFFVLVYSFLIDDFGIFEKLAFIPWQSLAQLTSIYVSIFICQIYFAHTIYVLHKKSKVLPAVIVLLALVAMAGAIAQVVISVHINQWTGLGKLSVYLNLQAACTLAADILITVGLSWRLNSTRSGVQSTNKLLNFLIINAINRGVLTMLTALLNMILVHPPVLSTGLDDSELNLQFLAEPGTFYFMLIVIISGKLYMNSMLAILNTRQHAKSIGQVTSGVRSTDISMHSFSAAPSHNLDAGITVAVTKDGDVGHSRSVYLDSAARYVNPGEKHSTKPETERVVGMATACSTA